MKKTYIYSAGLIAVLAAAPFYVLWKVLLLPRVIASSRSGAAWVRTERTGEKKLP